MHPLKTSLSFSTSLGRLSPVRDEVSSDDVPSMTLPSSGIFSPGFTNILSPILTSSGETCLVCSPTHKLA